MIKAVVLDVDGVIVGDQPGVNFPHPHYSVIRALKKVRESGIYVSLLTGKPVFGIGKIINEAHLNNIHVADGGAVGVDTIDNEILFQHLISKKYTREIINFYIKHNIYMEFVAIENYYSLKSQVNDFTKKRVKVLEGEPVLIDDGESIVNKMEYSKIILFTKDKTQTSIVKQTFAEKFGNDLSLNWTINPFLLPYEIGLITVKDISKSNGVEKISKYLNIPLENFLGIGDTMHDWQFIEHCGYGGTLGNADQKLKDLVLQKEYGFVGRGVNENGVLDILKHFGLLN